MSKASGRVERPVNPLSMPPLASGNSSFFPFLNMAGNSSLYSCLIAHTMRIPGQAILLSCVLAFVNLAGCHEPAPQEQENILDQEAFVLEYRFIEHEAKERVAEPGQHCTSALIENDLLTLWLWPDEDPPTEPWLALFPTLPVEWTSGLGNQPFKAFFPVDVNPHVRNYTTTFGKLEWESIGNRILLNGESIDTPHTWNVTSEDNAWTAELALDKWNGDVQVERYPQPCD